MNKLIGAVLGDFALDALSVYAELGGGARGVLAAKGKEMIEMKSVFGGIWKDAAVESVPASFSGELVVLEKATGKVWCADVNSIALNFGKGKHATAYWWLDRRAPAKLLPREAFDLLKVLDPGITGMSVQGADLVVHYSDDQRVRYITGISTAMISWDGDKSYTPPPEEKWIDATLENWKDFLLKRCQFLASDGTSWVDGVLIGMNPGGYWLVEVKNPRSCESLAYVSAVGDKLRFLVEPGREVVK